MRWAIYAHDIWDYYYSGGGDDNAKPIVTFDEKKDAKEYLKKSKLKRQSMTRHYRSKSFLCGYADAYVEEYHPASLPHNPTLP